ncbi:MAG TPA: DNA polymerase/3'-5' exonuclease PolX [Aggregatilineales bacterium]|nr:DNA polymerase/3'-5' exonuclease PolX [Aggregatilineales bacterium]
MTLTNRDIADLFERIGNLLEIKGESVHRWLAYTNAAESIRELSRDLRAIAAEGTLTDIPKVGKTLAAKIEELLDTGHLEFYDRLTAEIPASLVDVMHINGIGAKKARLFWEQLQIQTVAALEEAAKAGKLRDLPGMGLKSEQKVLDGIAALARRTGRTPLGIALPAAETILASLLELPQTLEGAIAGSIRRGRPTIGDVDLIVAVADMADSAPIMARFVAQPNVARVLGHGETKSSVELQNGLQVDVRVLPKREWGTGLCYFTGSQQHNIRLRELALARGYSLNEHAFSPVDADKTIIETADKVYCETEAQVYEMLGLPWIAPELREDSGEIERAQRGTLPRLITREDLVADLHMHTTWSDGTASIREMALAARERGLRYIVITEHSRSLGIGNGLSIERLLAAGEEVRAVDAEMNGTIRVLHGTEMDINADGSLDYPDDVLEKLDFVIASLHVSLRQDRAQITRRLLNAINNPHVDMIAHPMAQRIPEREPVDMDMDAVFAAALATDTALEVNANPIRLDLEAQHARRAAEMGIKIAVNTDAHSVSQLDLIPFGVLTARRAWLEPQQVINTWDFADFIAWTRS